MTGLLLDHLWQSTLFATCAGLVALALRNTSAQVRYWVWFAAAAKFLIPFVVIASAAEWLAAHLHAQATAPPRLELARHVLQPMTAPEHTQAAQSLARAPLGATPFLGAVWMLGAAMIMVRRAVQWRALTRALADAAPIALPTRLPAVATRTRSGPAVIGFFRPVLVLPPDLPQELTPAELEAVLEHELHHARRHDNLLALPLLLAQALFWFHPLIWWIGRQLLIERERACDEAVLQGGADAETYARGLLEVCRLQLEPARVLAAAVGGADLKRRIRRIMIDRPPRPLGWPGGLMLAAATGAVVAMPVLAGVFTAAPGVTARALAGLARPAIAAAQPKPAAMSAEHTERLSTKAQAVPVRIIAISAPAALIEPTTYGPLPDRPLRLARRAVAPAFQAAPTEQAAEAAVIQSAGAAEPSARADLVRALADRTAYVVRADVWSARLDLRSNIACPNGAVASAERRLGGTAISTAFDGPVRRFVDETVAGTAAPHNLSPAMAQAVDKALPVLQPALVGRFGAPGEAKLIGQDSRGRDVYLVRAGTGYVLLRVDDAGQIDAAMFCAGG